MKIAIIGAGAAGVFCAANINLKDAQILILESGKDALRKVLQSGGGRCNITNSEPNLEKFIKNYPRGGGSLRKPLRVFSPKDLIDWFEARNVEFIEENGGRVFPRSEESGEIVDCLMRECAKKKVQFKMPFTATKIERRETDFLIHGKYGDFVSAQKILVAIGGKWNEDLKKSLEDLGHKFVESAPSLFAFKTNYAKLTELSGISFENVKIKCDALKIEASGEMAITFEGLTGPAVLKLSSIGAKEFADLNYKFEIEVSTVKDAQEFKSFCENARKLSPKKLVKNFYPEFLPKRFWVFLLEKIGLSEEKMWSQFSSDDQKKLSQLLLGLPVSIVARAMNTREFVSCGGLEVSSVDFLTMQSKLVENLYFAGECLNIDGFTGGYNLQAAWTTAYIAAKNIEKI